MGCCIYIFLKFKYSSPWILTLHFFKLKIIINQQNLITWTKFTNRWMKSYFGIVPEYDMEILTQFNMIKVSFSWMSVCPKKYLEHLPWRTLFLLSDLLPLNVLIRLSLEVKQICDRVSLIINNSFHHHADIANIGVSEVWFSNKNSVRHIPQISLSFSHLRNLLKYQVQQRMRI